MKSQHLCIRLLLTSKLFLKGVLEYKLFIAAVRNKLNGYSLNGAHMPCDVERSDCIENGATTLCGEALNDSPNTSANPITNPPIATLENELKEADRLLARMASECNAKVRYLS